MPQTTEPLQSDCTVHIRRISHFKSTGLPILQCSLADYLYLDVYLRMMPEKKQAKEISHQYCSQKCL